MSEKVQTKVYLPEDLKALVDADTRNNSEVVEAALWREFGGQKQSALEQRLEEIDRRMNIVKQERKQRDTELQELREEKRGLETRIHEIENGLLSDEEIAEARGTLDDGERLFDTHPFVKGVAENHDIDVPSAHDAVKEQLGEEYPPIAFELSERGEPMNWKDAMDRDQSRR